MDRPNTVARLKAKRDRLIKRREELEIALRTVTMDIGYLDAAIRISGPADPRERQREYAVLYRTPKGEGVRFILEKLRKASEPVTSRDLAEMWCADHGLEARPSTVSLVRGRLGAALGGLQHNGLVRRDGFVEGRIGWRVA